MKNLKIAAAVACLLTGGCASVNSTVQLPNGDVGLAISCPGTQEYSCMNKAAEVCGGAYEILSSGGYQVSSAVWGRGRYTGFSAPVAQIMVRCEHALPEAVQKTVDNINADTSHAFIKN